MELKPTPALDYLSGTNPHGQRPGIRNLRGTPPNCLDCPFKGERAVIGGKTYRASVSCNLLPPEAVVNRNRALNPEDQEVIGDDPYVAILRPVCSLGDWQQLAMAELARLKEAAQDA